MSISMEFLGSEIQQSITFSSAANLNVDFIISNMERVCMERGIEDTFQKETVTSGNFFNKKSYDCVIVRHPNPPQEYAHQVYVVAKYMFKQPDKVAYEVEIVWHGQVIGAFNSLIHD